MSLHMLGNMDLFKELQYKDVTMAHRALTNIKAPGGKALRATR